MKAGLDDINELIGQVYDAAIQPDRWPAALSQLGELLGGAAFVMSALHRSEGMLLGVATGQDSALADILRKRYNTPQTNPLVAAVSGLRVGELVARRAVHADGAYFHGDLYNEVFRPQDLTHRVIACLHRTDDLVCPLGILRPRLAADFSGQDMRVLGMILPHLRRAVHMSLHLKALKDSALSLADALNRVPVGIFVADSRCRIVHFNSTAEKIAREQDGLWLRNGEFLAWRHREALALRDAIGLALARPHEAAAALSIRRRSGKRPYAVIVAPLAGESSLELGQAPRGVIVLVSDPSSAQPRRGRLLRELFNLTTKEAQLAEALLDGKRLEQYADEERVSINTARTHLRAIFAKTDTRRQAELVRVLNAMPAVERR